jgi:hypothetical protein
MSKKMRRKFTVEQKVRMLEEARAPNTTVRISAKWKGQFG